MAKGGPARICAWHRTGVPPWAPRRWFARECDACDAKVQAGTVSADDPEPAMLYRRVLDAQSNAQVARRLATIRAVNEARRLSR